MQLLLSLEHIQVTLGLLVANFNTVVSQGRGKPEERERRGEMGGQCISQNIHNIHQVHCLIWMQFIALQNNYNGNINDH